MLKKVVIRGEEWRILGVYVNKDMEEKLGKMKSGWKEGKRVMIGDDFNARTREGGGRVGMEEEEEIGRKSKDKKVNKKGRRLIEAIGKVGMSIMNGSVSGDEKGEYTYVGSNENTVIDYVIGGEQVRERIRKMTVGDKIDDH